MNVVQASQMIDFLEFFDGLIKEVLHLQSQSVRFV